MPCGWTEMRRPAGVRRRVAMWITCASVLAGGAAWVAAESRPEPGAASPGGLIPRDFEFVVDDLKVVSKGQLIVEDGFDRDGVLHPAKIRGKSAERAPYVISRGWIDGSRVRGGRLVMDQTGMVNTFESYSADLVVPIDESGRTWFVGKELFGDLEVSCKVIAPRIVGPSRFAIGVVDLNNWVTMGAVSVGPEELRLQRQGHPRFPYLPFIHSRFVVAVRDERRALDLLADPDAKRGDGLIAEEADDRSGSHRPEIAHRLRVQESPHRLVTRDRRAEGDRQDDGDAGQILDPAVAVGKPRAGLPAGQRERHPQRQGGGRVAEVVDGVGQQGDAAREPHDHHLDQRGREQAGEGPLEGPDASRGGGDGRLHHAVSVAVPAVIGGVVMRMTVSFAAVRRAATYGMRKAAHPVIVSDPRFDAGTFRYGTV